MSGDELRDAIAGALYVRDRFDSPTVVLADAILALPEMEQIRQYINGTLEDWCCIECRDANVDLPKSVIDWVLGKEARREQ